MPEPQFDDVSTEVRRIVSEYSEKNDLQFQEPAIELLLKGGREYHFVDELIDVLRLQQALSEIFTKLPPQEKQIGQSEIEIALQKSKCHYLWLC